LAKFKKYDPDSIFHSLLEFCESEEDREYASDHKFRFSRMINDLLPHLKPGIKVANIGVSILDPLMFKILEEYSVDYAVVVPDAKFLDSLHNPNFDAIAKAVCTYDVCIRQESSPCWNQFDIVMFYEVMEHLLAPDELILYNVSMLLKKGGLLLASVPNAVELRSRLSVLFGRNIFWSKERLINGVYNGYGHLRLYTFSEILDLLHPNFSVTKIYGCSPYNSSATMRWLSNRFLTKTLRSVIFVEAIKK